MCIDDCERRKGSGQRLAPAVPLPTGIIADDAEDDGDIMEEDCDAVDDVEYEEEEDKDVDLLDLELVNCCIEMEGNMAVKVNILDLARLMERSMM